MRLLTRRLSRLRLWARPSSLAFRGPCERGAHESEFTEDKQSSAPRPGKAEDPIQEGGLSTRGSCGSAVHRLGAQQTAAGAGRRDGNVQEQTRLVWGNRASYSVKETK